MWNLLTKDFLTISRDRSEVLSLLGMPMILIAILGFALGGVMVGNGDIDPIPVALIVENDLEQDMDQFQQALADEGLPEPAIDQIVTSIDTIDPETSFQALINDPNLNDVIDLSDDYSQDEAELALENDEIIAVITIPEQFSYDTLMAFYLNEETEATIELLVQNHENIFAGVIENIMTNFTEQYNLEVSIALATEGEIIESTVGEQNFGEITHLSTQEPVSAFQYYTFGMAVMFAMYVASTVSSNAFKEKTNHALGRLMLSGERPIRYLLSKTISGTILTMTQLMILFVASSLIFQIFEGMDLGFWLSVIFVSFVFSLTIGALAALLTAIALQFNSDAISGIFSGGVIVIFAFIGGSMMPIEQFPPSLVELGNWTPNGAMMTAYLQLIQGFDLQATLPMLYRVLGMAILFIVIAVAIFPKRRLS